MESLSDRIKQKRTEMNLTQTQLAALANTKQQVIQQVESGMTKHPRCLIDLAQALKCDPAWLLYGKKNGKAA